MLHQAGSTLLRAVAYAASAPASHTALAPLGVRMMSFFRKEYQVGFVGLGHMGSRMVNHLRGAGHHLVVYDSNSYTLERTLEEAQGTQGPRLSAVSSAAELAATEGLSVIFTMLPSVKAAREVYLGKEGLLAAPGGVVPSLVIDCTTMDPPTAREIAAVASKVRLSPTSRPLHGLDAESPTLLDAPVSGGEVGADAGTLSFMVGGEPAAVEAATPFLKAMGKRIVHCGDHGTGQAARLCNALVMAASMAAVSESLALARRLGVDPQVMTDVLNASSGRCWSSDSYNPVPGLLEAVPASKGYQAGFPVHMLLDQLQMAIDAGDLSHSPTPVAHAINALYGQIKEEGLSDRDFSSIYRYVYGAGAADDMEWKSGERLFASQIP